MPTQSLSTWRVRAGAAPISREQPTPDRLPRREGAGAAASILTRRDAGRDAGGPIAVRRVELAPLDPHALNRTGRLGERLGLGSWRTEDGTLVVRRPALPGPRAARPAARPAREPAHVYAEHRRSEPIDVNAWIRRAREEAPALLAARRAAA